MDTFLIDIPIPSMGATVNEIMVIDILVAPGTRFTKGQKLAEFESDKSAFDFEAPCEGVLVQVFCRTGDIVPVNQPFIRVETADPSLKHLQVQASLAASRTVPAPVVAVELPKAPAAVRPPAPAAPPTAPRPASDPWSRFSRR